MRAPASNGRRCGVDEALSRASRPAAKAAGGAFAAALCAIFAAQPAAAQEITNVKGVDIVLQGHVSQRCAMGASAVTDLGDLNRPRISAATQLQLDCNVPFTMSIKAQNGAIQNIAMPGGQGEYLGSVPYSLDVSLPIRRPERDVITKVFEGRSLVGGQVISSLGGIAQDGLLLRLKLGTVASPAGLLAGEYSETIVITIAPS